MGRITLKWLLRHLLETYGSKGTITHANGEKEYSYDWTIAGKTYSLNHAEDKKEVYIHNHETRESKVIWNVYDTKNAVKILLKESLIQQEEEEKRIKDSVDFLKYYIKNIDDTPFEIG